MRMRLICNGLDVCVSFVTGGTLVAWIENLAKRDETWIA